ncbi:conserved protein of unknown function [Bartonella clarridgeiae 73]|uniref:DUF4167 domain-containing protein n=1 Tax=Bartonella clarridgeiae (strain CCUG 45776 / CIP 104772 / 73) TaxID=696125 RepID=E6YIZ9_BARC7|nr:DUF4167 domain-containing protein [Bartonella clarridgeiae]WCR55935.1 MAG: hypothetical protein PG977_001328 [Bartonella clarridgeiae]CBI76837.1 conserved protein of unknown function [Bartonella clarridgeiae 73]
MRPQQNRRVRGRNNNSSNNNNRRGPNPLSRNYESNGPDVKIRGNAQQIADKYIGLARDAQGAGDRVMSENYLQHAEHYLRIILAAADQMSQSHKNEQECEETSAEENIRGGNNGERPSLREQSLRNGDGRKGKEKEKCAEDQNSRSDQADQKEQQIVEEGTETVKQSRRVSRRRKIRGSETLSSEQSAIVSESAEKNMTSAEKIIPLPLLNEKEQKKPRRRRSVSSSSAEENT